MAAAHRRIEHLELQDLSGLWILLGAALGNLRPQGLLHEEADERVRCVVRTCSLPAESGAQIEPAGRNLFDPLDLSRGRAPGFRIQGVFLVLSLVISECSILPISDVIASNWSAVSWLR